MTNLQPVRLCPTTFLEAVGYPHKPLSKSATEIIENHKSVGLDIDYPEPFEPKPPKLTLADIEALNQQGSELTKELIYWAIFNDVPVPCFDDFTSGWMQWLDNTWLSCSPPQNQRMVLDTETCLVSGYWYPRVAVAVTCDGDIYRWVSPFYDTDGKDVRFIPFGTDNLVIGHNVNYDRAYLESEYRFPCLRPQNRFIDTMSLVQLTHGIGNQQRSTVNLGLGEWSSHAISASLQAAYKYYTGKNLDKDVRKNIETAGITQDMLGDVTYYCFCDVLATKEVLGHSLADFSNTRPNGFSMMGHLSLGSEFLPLSPNWYDYLSRCELAYQDKLQSISDSLMRLADKILDAPHDDNIWLSSLDWKLLKSGKNKGKPKWYSKISNAYAKGDLLSPHQRDICSLLQLTIKTSEGVLPVWYNNSDKKWYQGDKPVKHPDSPQKRVTDMFIKGFTTLFENGTIGSDSDLEVAQILADMNSTINWKSLRQRLEDTTVNMSDLGLCTIPGYKNSGTLTGRKTDKVWVVSPNPKRDRIGTELKSLIQAPPGYKFVSFDIDSQELRLFALLGDSVSKVPGYTPLSASCLLGSKNDGTDVHTLSGKSAGISRQDSKVLVYGSIYGMGQQGAIEHLVRNGQELSQSTSKVDSFQTTLKGFKFGDYPNQFFGGGLASESFNVANSRLSVPTLTENVFGTMLPFSLHTDDFVTTRFNWIIQSSGRDYLDLFTSLLESKIKDAGIDARIVLTIHDECHLLVKEDDALSLVDWVFQCHALAWVYVCKCLELDSVPLDLLYPESVSIDTVIRKSPFEPCITPSQTVPIEPGIEITREDYLRQS